VSGRGAEPPYSVPSEAREGIDRSTLHQSSHGLATHVHGFATKTKALAREIPPALQPITLIASDQSLSIRGALSSVTAFNGRLSWKKKM